MVIHVVIDDNKIVSNAGFTSFFKARQFAIKRLNDFASIYNIGNLNLMEVDEDELNVSCLGRICKQVKIGTVLI